MANIDLFEHEPEKFGARQLPPRSSSAALMDRTPEMPRPETLPHSDVPLTDEERALVRHLLYR